MLKKLTLNIMVKDVDKTVEFYKDILTCFELVDSESSGEKLDWALVRCGNIQIMFESKESMASSYPLLLGKDVGGSILIYIEMEGIKDLYKHIKDRVTIVKGLEDTSYGMKEFSILDCNGFLIVFAEWVGIREFFNKSVYNK